MAKHAQFWGFIAGAIIAFGFGWWGFARAGSDFSPEPGMPNGTFDGASENPVKALTQSVRRHNGRLYAEKTSLEAQEDLPGADKRALEAQIRSLDLQKWSSSGMEAIRCVFSSFGLLRFYDLYQPGEAPWQLIAAQFLVPGVALFGAAAVFLVGVRKNFRTVMARHKSNHTVVCGIGDVGMQVVENLRKKDPGRKAGQRIVVVDLHDDSPAAATCEQSGVLVVQGDAKSPQVLKAAGIHHAQQAIISTGSDSENIDIALQIKDIYKRTSNLAPGSIRVLAQLRNDWMHKRLLGSDKSLTDSAGVDLRLFNPFTDAARLLIKPLRLLPSPEFDAQTFVLIGFGQYGREIALHLIRSSPVALGQKLRIIVFDEKADKAKERFSVTNPAALEWASVEFVKANVSEGSPDLTRVLEPKLEEAKPLLGIAVALGDDQVSLSAALEVRSILDRNSHLHVPVYVRLEYYRRLGELVRDLENKSSFGDRVQIFGTLEETLSPGVLLESKLDKFALALHAEYLSRPKEDKNPKADVEWPRLPEIFKMSNRWRADHSPLLMQLAGMYVQDPESPEVATTKAPAVAPLSAAQIETLARLEHRRYQIERRMVENRPRSAWRDDPSLYDWTDSPDNKKELAAGNKDYNREEVAKLPQIMAELGIEMLPVRPMCLYGKWLAEAAKEIDRSTADARAAHYNLIVDLDNHDAIRAAGHALTLPSRSVWLVSDELPPEFGPRRKAKADEPEERPAVIEQANGWAKRNQVALQK